MARAQHGARLVVLVLLAAVLTPRAADAQTMGVALDHYRGAETTNDGFAISRPSDAGWLTVGAQLHLDYASAPLILVPDDPTDMTRTLVEHLLAARVGGFVGLIDRLVFFTSIPVVGMIGGGRVAGFPGADDLGLGDLDLGARARLFGEEDDIGAVAIQLTGSFPTAEAANAAQDLSGEQGATFSPEVLGELRFAPVHITGNLGFRLRERVTHTNLDIGQELTWGVGAGLDLLDRLLEIRVEGYGSVGLESQLTAQRTPAEAIVGLRVRPVDGLVVGLAGGFGIGSGYGTPGFRGVLSVGYAAPIEAAPTADEAFAANEPDASPGPTSDPVDERDPEAPPDPIDERDPEAPPDPIDERDPEAPPDPVEATDAPEDEAAPTPPLEPTWAGRLPRRPRTVARPSYEELDRDGDRVVDAHDQCPLDFEDFDEIQDEDGCPEADADGDETLDQDDACPLTPGPRRQRSRRCAGCPELACVDASTGQITISERVEFETDEAVLLESSDGVLNAVLSIMSTNDQLVLVRIEGHTDDRGTDEHNFDLSRRRAEAVVQWLVDRGIARERFVGFGCGELHPLTENRSRRGRARNRRVEFLIVDPPSGQTLHEGCQELAPSAAAE